MNLATVYKAFRKQAAGEMPGQPAGGVYKPKPLPPPITAPGSVPIDQGMAPEPAAQQPQQGVDAKMLEKGWEKTMEAMQNMTAMNNGMPPQMGTPAQEQSQPVGAGVPGQQMPGADQIAPPPLPKMAAVNYSTIYKSMAKRAKVLWP